MELALLEQVLHLGVTHLPEVTVPFSYRHEMLGRGQAHATISFRPHPLAGLR
jgi:hypothetical protein